MSNCNANGFPSTLSEFAKNGCFIKIPGSCVLYTGANVPSLGIVGGVGGGDTFNSVVTKLITAIGSGTGGPSLAALPLYVAPGNVISITAASSSTNGYITASDYNLFFSKVGPTRTINTVGPLAGGGDLSAKSPAYIISPTSSPDIAVVEVAVLPLTVITAA